jgi:hypothetical protein
LGSWGSKNKGCHFSLIIIKKLSSHWGESFICQDLTKRPTQIGTFFLAAGSSPQYQPWEVCFSVM